MLTMKFKTKLMVSPAYGCINPNRQIILPPDWLYSMKVDVLSANQRTDLVADQQQVRGSKNTGTLGLPKKVKILTIRVCTHLKNALVSYLQKISLKKLVKNESDSSIES